MSVYGDSPKWKLVWASDRETEYTTVFANLSLCHRTGNKLAALECFIGSAFVHTEYGNDEGIHLGSHRRIAMLYFSLSYERTFVPISYYIIVCSLYLIEFRNQTAFMQESFSLADPRQSRLTIRSNLNVV